MRKAVLGTFLVTGLTLANCGFAQHNAKSEFGNHSRIANAVRALERAIEYMERTPHDFGGHKAQAIADSRKAIEQLREAMKYRGSQDHRGNLLLTPQAANNQPPAGGSQMLAHSIYRLESSAPR